MGLAAGRPAPAYPLPPPLERMHRASLPTFPGLWGKLCRLPDSSANQKEKRSPPSSSTPISHVFNTAARGWLAAHLRSARGPQFGSHGYGTQRHCWHRPRALEMLLPPCSPRSRVADLEMLGWGPPNAGGAEPRTCHVRWEKPPFNRAPLLQAFIHHLESC